MSVSHNNFAQQIQFETRLLRLPLLLAVITNSAYPFSFKKTWDTYNIAGTDYRRGKTQLCSATPLRKIEIVKQKKVHWA